MNYNHRYKIPLACYEAPNIKKLFEALKPEITCVFMTSNENSTLKPAIAHQPETIGMIRNNDIFKNIPILVSTGKMSGIKNLRITVETGANNEIRKTINIQNN